MAAWSLAGDPALHCLAWARDGRTLLAAGADGRARLLDVASRAEVSKAVGRMRNSAWIFLLHMSFPWQSPQCFQLGSNRD